MKNQKERKKVKGKKKVYDLNEFVGMHKMIKLCESE